MSDRDAEPAAPAPAARAVPAAFATRTLQPLAFAFAFLTRLPFAPPGSCEPDAAARSLPWFPLVGLALGALQALLGLGLTRYLPAAVCAVILVALSAWLTGALHLDGLADVFDGLGGSRGDPARALAIMRDSRIGSFGTVALVLVLAGKLAALEPLLASRAFAPILLAPLAARAAIVPLVARFPYARESGLGKSFHDHARAHHGALAALATAFVTAAAAPVLLAASAATFLFAFLFARWLSRKLGGLTGDTHGATIELSELGFLVLAGLTPS